MLWNKQPAPSTGELAETLAAQYIERQHVKILEKNVHCRQGEIDIIALDGTTRIFIEVKYRKNNHYGGAISAVSLKKQQKIQKTAKYYLQQHGLNEYNTDCRFDVITLEGDINHPKITWLKNAF